MEAFYPALLAASAFWLGACPFSLWIGRLVLGKDIRDYGDGNPGAANVLRAGGRKSFCLALILDLAKGAPFVFWAHSVFALPEPAVFGVACSAILGHAFSPMLGFKGGKAIAVTGGALLALPQREIALVVAVFLFLSFLFIKGDAWIVMFGLAASLGYLVISRSGSWQYIFLLCVIVIIGSKQFDELKTGPRWSVRMLSWVHSRRRAT